MVTGGPRRSVLRKVDICVTGQSENYFPRGGVRKPRTPDQIADNCTLFDYPVTKVGAVGNVNVYYDPSLGASKLIAWQPITECGYSYYNDMQTFFGVTGAVVNVIIASLSGNNDGTGGGYHHGCDFAFGADLYLDATFSSVAIDPLSLEVALYVAELSECFMGPQGNGWTCNDSNGEGLSRFCAEQETSLGTFIDYATGPAWVQAGLPDWVNQTETTDENEVSAGCAVVYLYWMCSLGFTVPQIVQAGGSTLAANYQALTGKNTAYQDLSAAVRNLTVTSDDPFPRAVRLNLFYGGGDGNLIENWFDGNTWNVTDHSQPANTSASEDLR